MKLNKRVSGVSVALQSTISNINNQSLETKQKPPEFSIKIANTLEERESAFRLGYQCYLDKGYINKNKSECLVRSYDFDSETVILIVQDQHKKVVGTVSLVFDGSSYLPAEKAYSNELLTFRNSGSTMVEMSRLACDPNYRNVKQILILLINYSAIYIRLVKNYNSLIIEVNPRHKNYYLALLNCEEVGSTKECAHVGNAPAVLLYLSAIKYQFELNRFIQGKAINKCNRSLYPYFLKPEQEKLVASYLKNQVKVMSMEEKLYFGFSHSGFCKAVEV